MANLKRAQPLSTIGLEVLPRVIQFGYYLV